MAAGGGGHGRGTSPPRPLLGLAAALGARSAAEMCGSAAVRSGSPVAGFAVPEADVGCGAPAGELPMVVRR
jgi:hypothetical protein